MREEIIELPYDDYMLARWEELDSAAKVLLNLEKDVTAHNYIMALWSKQYWEHHALKLQKIIINGE